MKVIADVCVVPIGVGISLSKYIAECERIFAEVGLIPNLHANGTNVEGEWDTVFKALERCHNVVHEMGAPRIFTTIRLGTRIDREQTLTDKVRRLILAVGDGRKRKEIYGGGAIIDEKQAIIMLTTKPDESLAIWSRHTELAELAKIYFLYLYNSAQPLT